MPEYCPPVDDMRFTLEALLGFSHPDFDGETIAAILEEAAKLAGQVLAPLNHRGDREGAKLSGNDVITPSGFKEAYRQYCEAGWNGVPFDPAYGGQGLPWALAFPLQEMWQGANLSFGLCPLLNQGAVEAIAAHGSPEQKEYYLPKLISGEWAGTMNLTEPQAGSDLGAIRTKAVPQDDGSYSLTGQKIYITFGEHDFTDNIIHLVLARTPEAPDGVKGISMFVVPKILPGGTRNDLACTGLEHKLGIHACPTCTMNFGDRGGATGWLVGEENQGLKYMFTMMNNARLAVGLQGVALAERASQAALSYARERTQGRAGAENPAPIIRHADVRRMLLEMRALTEAGRMLAYDAALWLDRARAGEDGALDRVGLLTPVVKAWCTDMAVHVASTGVQIFGGMGFIEEAGAAQLYRDARILPIYEGTNGIQAADLVHRKILRDGGAAFHAWLDEQKEHRFEGPESEALTALENATARLLDLGREGKTESVAALASIYLELFGIVAGGLLMDRAGRKAGGEGNLYIGKAATATFYRTHILPRAAGPARTISEGEKATTAIEAYLF